MGIRHAKSVAYLSRSNGRAEVAGRQLFEKLRKIHITNPRRNWFEEMWPALKAHHDTPTPGGLSPHQILFGRDPLGRGLPLSGDGMAMDAKEFFARQEQTARDIRQQLEKEHAERQKSAPSSTAQKFRVGDPMWVIRPRPMGTHRTKTWFTPGEVVRRIGEDTYRIKVGHGQFRERHESQLRVREPDLRGQHVSLSYAAHEADSDDDYAEQDDYTVEKILAQHPKASAPGGLEFKVCWRGYGPVPRHLGTRLLVRAAGQYSLHGVHLQAQDQDPCFGLGSTHPGDCSQGCLISALSSPLMCFEALVRPTDRPSLACSLSSSGDLPSEWPYTPLLNPEEDGPSLLLFVTPPPAESLGNQVGRLTFIFLSSWGLEAHTTLRNGCRCHRHCDFWCVVWFHVTCGIQTSRRVSRDYIWPELRRFPVQPPAFALS